MTGLRDHRTNGLCWRERPARGATPAATLVCLHGIGSDAQSFDALAQAVDPDVRVIAWVAPGYGGSYPLPADWPVAADYAAALAGLTTALGLSRYAVLGHSLGTLIGAAHALTCPDRVSALVLVSCAQGMGVAPGAALPERAAARIHDLQAQGGEEFARARAPNLVHDPDAHPDLVAGIAAAMSRVTMPGYGQAVRMLASGDLAGMAAGLAVPTTVVVGQEDRVTPPAQSQAVHAAVPQAVRRDFILLPGVGHAAPQQAPGAIAGILRAALAGPPTATDQKGETA